MATKQVKRNSGAMVDVTFYADETTLDADADVTYDVTKADGTSLTTGTAAHVGAADSGTYRFTLAPQANLDLLTATFTGTFGGVVQSQTVQIEIVGGFYVALSEIRVGTNLTDNNKFTTAKLVAARHWFETLAESVCGVSFVPRFTRERLSGRGGSEIAVSRAKPRTLLSARYYSDATTSTAFDVTDLADAVPTLLGFRRVSRGVWTAGSDNFVVEYEAGYDEPPADIRQAALEAIRDLLLNDRAGRPMLSVADGAGGTTRYAMPGEGRPTGLPSVDSVLSRYRLIPVG